LQNRTHDRAPDAGRLLEVETCQQEVEVARVTRREFEYLMLQHQHGQPPDLPRDSAPLTRDGEKLQAEAFAVGFAAQEFVEQVVGRKRVLKLVREKSQQAIPAGAARGFKIFHVPDFESSTTARLEKRV